MTVAKTTTAKKTTAKATQSRSKTTKVVAANTKATVEKAASKKDLEAQKKAATENLKKKQEATEKQFLARIDNMISSFETVSGWLTCKDTLADVMKNMTDQKVSFGDAAELSRRVVEMLHGVRDRFEAVEGVEEYKDFFDSFIDHDFNNKETTIMQIALEVSMLNIARALDGQLQEAYHFNEDAKEAIAKIDKQIKEL